MSNSYTLEFTDLPAVVIFKAECESKWNSWQDFIVVIKNGNHNYTAVARKLADEFVDGATDQVWTTIHLVERINDAETFVTAVRDCEMELNVNVDWDEVVTKMVKLDKPLADSVKEVISAD